MRHLYLLPSQTGAPREALPGSQDIFSTAEKELALLAGKVTTQKDLGEGKGLLFAPSFVR